MRVSTSDVAVLPHPRTPGDVALVPLVGSRPVPPVSAETLVALDDADRDAIADLLHDTVAQHVVAARLAAGIRSDEARALVLDPLELASAQLRDLCWWLRPRGAQGLEPALGELADRPHPFLPGQPSILLDVDLSAAATQVSGHGAAGQGLVGPAAGAVVRLVQAVALAAGPASVELVVGSADGETTTPCLRIRGAGDALPELSPAARGLVVRAAVRAAALGVDVRPWPDPSRFAGPLDDTTLPDALLGGLLVRLPPGAAPTTGEDLP